MPMLACIEYLQHLSEYESSQDAYLNFKMEARPLDENSHGGQ